MTEPTEDKIEITPEMVDAAVEAMSGHYLALTIPEAMPDICRDVLRAALAVSRKAPK